MACGLKFRVYLPVTSLVKLLYIALCNKTFNTMHKLFALLTLLCLCSSMTEEHAVLKLNNSKVYFADIPPGSDMRSYSTDSLRNKSVTVISYTLSNPTDEKLLFVINLEDFYPYPASAEGRDVLGVIIKDKSGNVVKDNPSITDYNNTNEDHYYVNVKQRELELKLRAQALLGSSDLIDNYINNSIILHPGETKTFRVLVSLPIFLEHDGILRNGGAAWLNVKEGYTFQLFYKCNAKELKGSLPKYLRDELEQNDIETYNGTLYSKLAELSLKK
jgi:hypothetical protein